MLIETVGKKSLPSTRSTQARELGGIYEGLPRCWHFLTIVTPLDQDSRSPRRVGVQSHLYALDASDPGWGLRSLPPGSLPSAISQTAAIASRCHTAATCLSPCRPRAHLSRRRVHIYPVCVPSNGWRKESDRQMLIFYNKLSCTSIFSSLTLKFYVHFNLYNSVI